MKNLKKIIGMFAVAGFVFALAGCDLGPVTFTPTTKSFSFNKNSTYNDVPYPVSSITINSGEEYIEVTQPVETSTGSTFTISSKEEKGVAFVTLVSEKCAVRAVNVKVEVWASGQVYLESDAKKLQYSKETRPETEYSKWHDYPSTDTTKFPVNDQWYINYDNPKQHVRIKGNIIYYFDEDDMRDLDVARVSRGVITGVDASNNATIDWTFGTKLCFDIDEDIYFYEHIWSDSATSNSLWGMSDYSGWNNQVFGFNTLGSDATYYLYVGGASWTKDSN